MKVSEQIRELLNEGPATARELALSAEVPMRRVTIGQWVLKKQHHVCIAGTVENLESGRGQRHRLKLYKLTLRGKTYVSMWQKTRAA